MDGYGKPVDCEPVGTQRGMLTSLWRNALPSGSPHLAGGGSEGEFYGLVLLGDGQNFRNALAQIFRNSQYPFAQLPEQPNPVN